MVKAIRVFSYSKGSPDGVGTPGPDVGYDLCSVEADGVRSLCGVQLLLIVSSPI
jgi:hypothetical protein